MRITLEDIISFSLNSDGSYQPIEWPKEYWPASQEPPDKGAWQRSIDGFLEQRRRFEEVIVDSSLDLIAPFPWGEGQNLLREVLLVIEHTAYHLGELLVLRRLMGAWKS